MSLLKDLEFMLHQYLADVHALEKHVLHELDSMIATTKEEQLLAALKHHKAETEQHIARLKARFDAHYEQPSPVKDASARFAAFFQALRNILRDEKPAKNARDAFVTEHLEIAAYELLERLAVRAGDPETARVARQNRAEEEAMAHAIAATWDPVVDQTLAEEGVLAQATGR
jgi:ferritin-like metal-binding protein YciE